MKKNRFYDIVPKEKRSIRNISIEAIRGESPSDSSDTEESPKPAAPRASMHHGRQMVDGMRQAHVQAKEEKPEPEEHIKIRKVSSRAEARKQPAKNIEIEPAFMAGSAEDFESPEEEEGETFENWNKKKRFHPIWIAAGLVVVGLLYAGASYFTGAEIVITPVRHEVFMDNLRVPLKDVDYKPLEFDASSTVTVKASGLTSVEKQASGTVVLYNSYSTAVQKLSVNTRLVAPNNLIYKTAAAVTIPGSKVTGGKTVPGSVSVKVVAEAAGEAYNAPFTDFSIVAYKGTDKYTKIYGRSSTAIAGGYKGDVPNVSTSDIAKATATLKGNLGSTTDALALEKIRQLPEGYVYVPGSVYVGYDAPVQKTNKDATEVTISQHAHAVAVIINSKDLSSVIAKSTDTVTSDSVGSRVVFGADVAQSKATFQTDINADAVKRGSVSLYLQGTSTVASSVDQVSVTKAVSGLSKDQALLVVRDMVEAESVEIVVRPWWTSKLPRESKNIQVLSK